METLDGVQMLLLIKNKMDNFDLKKYLAEGKLFEEDFKNPILDKYLELKKSIDYKTVFPTDLQSFVDSLDNTERDGLESDLGLERDELYEGKLHEQKSPKFKIGDFVQPIEGATSYLLDEPRGTISSKYVGQIEDVYINKPENLEIKDGEYLYSVDKLNHRGRMAMSSDFKESDLESISDPTDYIKSLTPYRRRN